MRLQIAMARLVQRVGWAGVAGISLVVIASLGFAYLRSAAEHERPSAASSSTVAIVPDAPSPKAPETPVLPPVGDVPLVLTRIQRSAVAHGLGWPRADYRLNAATEEAPASLDLRCVLKGPYPSVRAFVTEVLLDVPTLTLREFNLSRPTSETTDVEAKLSMVVYLSGPAREPSHGAAAQSKEATR